MNASIGNIATGAVVFINRQECSLLCVCGSSMKHARSAETSLGQRHTLECTQCDRFAYLYANPLFCIRSDEIPQGKSVGEYAAERVEELRQNTERALALS